MEINLIFSILYDQFYFKAPFTYDIFDEGIYAILGLSGLLISLFLVLFFYFIINRPSFSRWYHWLIMLIINLIIAFIIGVVIPKNIFGAISLEYTWSEYIQFSLIHALITTLFFIVWTYCFKWLKSHAKGTPKLFFGKF